jgi:hypothetical protein
MLSKNEGQKAKLVQNIIESSKTIRRDIPSGCYDLEILRHFTYLWYELSNYYRDYDDGDIEVELVGIFLDFVHEFGVVWNDEKTLPACKEQAYDALTDLRAFMDSIISSVQSRKYPQG